MDAIRLQTGQRIDKDGRGTPNLPSTTIAVVNQSIKAAFVTGHDGGDGVRERNLVSVSDMHPSITVVAYSTSMGVSV